MIGRVASFIVWAYRNNFDQMRKTIDSFFKDYSKTSTQPDPAPSDKAEATQTRFVDGFFAL